MTTLEFIDALLGRILSWPVLLLVAVLIFRKPVAELIRATSRVKWGDKDFQFDRILDDAEKSASETQNEAGSVGRPNELPTDGAKSSNPSQQEDFVRMAESSPSGAVVVAWARLEREQVDLAERAGVQLGRARHPQAVAEWLVAEDLLPRSYVTAIEDLRRLRAVVAHGEHIPSVGEAVTYVQQVEKLRQVVRHASPRGSE